MLKFLATTENDEKIVSEKPIYNRGKVVEKAAANCHSQFPDIKLHERRYKITPQNRNHSDRK